MEQMDAGMVLSLMVVYCVCLLSESSFVVGGRSICRSSQVISSRCQVEPSRGVMRSTKCEM